MSRERESFLQKRTVEKLSYCCGKYYTEMKFISGTVIKSASLNISFSNGPLPYVFTIDVSKCRNKFIFMSQVVVFLSTLLHYTLIRHSIQWDGWLVGLLRIHILQLYRK